MGIPVEKLAESIGRADAGELRRRFAADPRLANDDRAVALATLLASGYPALAPSIAARPEDVVAVARAGLRARDAKTLRRASILAVPDLGDVDAVRASLRRFARREKLRIATREL